MQGIDRVVCIGQERDVLIFSVYVRGSIDARIYELQLDKAKMAVVVVKDAQMDIIYTSIPLSDVAPANNNNDLNIGMFPETSTEPDGDTDQETTLMGRKKKRKNSNRMVIDDETEDVYSFTDRHSSGHRKRRGLVEPPPMTFTLPAEEPRFEAEPGFSENAGYWKDITEDGHLPPIYPDPEFHEKQEPEYTPLFGQLPLQRLTIEPNPHWQQLLYDQEQKNYKTANIPNTENVTVEKTAISTNPEISQTTAEDEVSVEWRPVCESP